MSEFINPQSVAVQGIGFGHKAIALQGFRVGISVTIVAGKPSIYVPTAAGRMLVPEYYIVTMRVWFQGRMMEKAFRVKRHAMEKIVCTRMMQRVFDIDIEAILNLKADEEITVEAKLL